MVGKKAVQAIGHIALAMTNTEGLIEELLNLLGSGDPVIVREVRKLILLLRSMPAAR
jgi:hypothetical protein